MVRLKTRYLIAAVSAPPSTRKLALQRDDITTIIKDSLARSYGDYGVGMSQYVFHVLYYNAETNLLVIRCARDQTKVVETSLIFVTEFKGQEVRFRVARVCGSSRTCRQHLLEFTMERVAELHLEAANPNVRAELAADIQGIDAQ